MMNNIFNNGGKNANSLLPLGVPGANAINRLRVNVENLNNKVNNTLTNLYKNLAENTNKVTDVASNVATNVAANVVPNVGSNLLEVPANTTSTGMMSMLGIFAVLVFLFLLAFTFFSVEITEGLNSIWSQIRSVLGMKVPLPGDVAPPPDSSLVLKPSTKPEDERLSPSSQIAEKILPTGGANPEVFSVSKNTFTYYDAEPLCKALGAELATYDQVKQAWERGADWCNYGWVKGQNAIYPTQKDTWEKLQSGPEEQRMACGRPGLNGGYFDNPELRFGVNCYGSKPSQSKHDEEAVAKRTGVPLTPSGIEFEKKVSKYRTDADNIGVLPFNGEKWSSS